MTHAAILFGAAFVGLWLGGLLVRADFQEAPHPHTLRLIIERAYKAALSFAVLVLLGHIGWSLGSVIGEALR